LFEGRKWEIMLSCQDNESVDFSDYTFDLVKVFCVVSGDVE